MHSQQQELANIHMQQRQLQFEREKQLQNEKIDHINELLKKQNELLAMAENSQHGHRSSNMSTIVQDRTNHSTNIYPSEIDNMSTISMVNRDQIQDSRNLSKQHSAKDFRSLRPPV